MRCYTSVDMSTHTSVQVIIRLLTINSMKALCMCYAEQTINETYPRYKNVSQPEFLNIPISVRPWLLLLESYPAASSKRKMCGLTHRGLQSRFFLAN